MTRTPAPTTASSVAPPPETASTGLAARLTSRWGARVAVLLFVLATILVSGAMRSAEVPPRGDAFPGSAESAVVAERLTHFPDAGRAPVLLVGTRDDGGRLTADDVAAMTALGDRPQRSEDGRAVVVTRDVTLGRDGSETAETVRAIRADVAAAAPDGLTVQVTGGPAFGADLASSFDGANVTLLLVTIGVVALLLLLTYRSPILWILPLLVVAVADQVAGRVTAAVGDASGLSFDAGIISVLVFGAGTNYALLLISRYRDELRARTDHRAALALAWRRTVPAILASNLTVVLALLTLLLASVRGTRGLGLSGAVVLLAALGAVLLVLPGVLAMAGQRAFWPFVPRPGDAQKDAVWGRIAGGVVRRPGAVLAGGIAVLAVLASGILGTRVGLPQADAFRGETESAAGLETLGTHFPAGSAAPMTVLARTDHTGQVVATLKQVDGVTKVAPTGVSADRGTTKILVMGEPAPGTDAALDLARDLRDAAHSVGGAEAVVGGGSADELDSRTAAWGDLRTVVPVVLGVCLLVLVVLLRSLVGPVVLLLLNVTSAVASLGLGAFLSERLLGFPALDTQVPLIAFLFLVALGVDYTIFLVHRARADGIVTAVERTGTVITSAGIVLAAVFAALGVLPLVVLAQLGLVVGLGVLIDTTVVRALVVPAAMALLGDRFWWPSGPARGVASRP